MYIGDIYLPILSNIDKKPVTKITKEIAGVNIEEPKSVTIRHNLQPITIEGYLYNDGNKNDVQYAEDVEALQYRSAGYCYTKYADLDGYIEIESADAPQSAEELGVRNYSIEGKYLPASKYERVVEIETEMRENEFNIAFPPHVALPVGATNVRVKTSQDSVKLTSPAFMAGNVPLYRPFPAFYPDDVTHSTGDTPKYDATAYKLSYNPLNATGESISFTMTSGIDIPLGDYRLVLRIKADTSVEGDVNVTISNGTTDVVNSYHTLSGSNTWNIIKTATFSINQRGLPYTVTVSKATDSVSNIAVNYGFLLPEKRARVAFDVAAEYDVGECKVYDTVTTDAAEAGWIQVYNPEHDFAGDIVVQNSMFRWVIKQSIWKEASKLYNITYDTPAEIGNLYNKAFGDEPVAIKFKEIKPNYVKFVYELSTGNTESGSTNAKETDTVEITPFNIVIDKDVVGTYKNHYTFETTTGTFDEIENGVIIGNDSDNVYGLIKSADFTSSMTGNTVIETTTPVSRNSYIVPFVVPCTVTSYLYKQAADLTVSKDNGDVERKFWKDDFSVDSSGYYTGDVNDFVWNTENNRVVCHATIVKVINRLSENFFGYYEMTLWGNNSSEQTYGYLYLRNNINNYIRIYPFPSTSLGYSSINCDIKINNLEIYHSAVSSAGINKTDPHRFGFEVLPDSVKFYVDGILKSTYSGTQHLAINTSVQYIQLQCNNKTSPPTADVYISNYIHLPSISYTDDFTSDTVSGATGRYRSSYANTYETDCLRLACSNYNTTALRSYLFGSGNFVATVKALPAAAPVGAKVGIIPHGQNLTAQTGTGFTVGVIKTATGWAAGWGNGKSLTSLGTDVPNLVDGDSVVIDVDSDQEHGVAYAYIYKVGNYRSHPDCVAFKFYHTVTTEGQFGLWAYYDGGGYFEISNITIRAESIVGRTNVEVEEPFWFRDECTVDALNRYIKTGTWTLSDDAYACSAAGNLALQLANVKSQTTSFDIGIPSGATNYFYLEGYRLKMVQGATSCAITLQTSTGTPVGTTTWTKTVNAGTKFTIEVVTDATTITVKDGIGGEVKITETITPIVTYDYWTGTNGTTIDNIQIAGTRVYNRPIHRGAMLESYYDGTEEVVGTALNYDFNWNCLNEFTGVTSSTVDTNNGRLTLADTSYVYPTGLTLKEGYYQFNVMRSTTSGSISFYIAGNEINITYDGIITFNGGTAEPYTVNVSSISNIGFFVTGTSFAVYENNIYKGTKTGLTLIPSNVKLKINTSPFYIYNINIIAEETNSVNGIAASIGGIGSGARYGVEENVYNSFTSADISNGQFILRTKAKTTNEAADDSSLALINVTDSTTPDSEPLTLTTSYATYSIPITVDAEPTDVMKVAVINSTTCNLPNTYVDSLEMIPVSGNNILYPQDLSFISTNVVSKKRKVEVR